MSDDERIGHDVDGDDKGMYGEKGVVVNFDFVGGLAFPDQIKEGEVKEYRNAWRQHRPIDGTSIEDSQLGQTEIAWTV